MHLFLLKINNRMRILIILGLSEHNGNIYNNVSDNADLEMLDNMFIEREGD